MSIVIIDTRHDWSVDVGSWRFGLIELEPNPHFGSGTTICLGPTGTFIENVSAPVVASVFGLTCAVIVAFIAVRFVFRPRRTPAA